MSTPSFGTNVIPSTVSAAFWKAPTFPTSVTTSQVDETTDIALSWDKNAATNITGYRVYVGTTLHNTGGLIAQPAGATVTYTVTGLTVGTSYNIYVATVDDGNQESPRVPKYVTIADPVVHANMTSNTAPAPYIVSASNESGGLAWKALDGDPSGFWGTDYPVTTMPAWWKVDLGTARTVRRYALSARNDAYYQDSPKDWEFQGSNDNTSWTTLHSTTGQTGWTSGQTRTFSVANETAYRYYRFVITAHQGYAVAIGMLKLYKLA